MAKKEGNCYATCEALYHLLGGKKAGYKPMRLKVNPKDKECHWFLALSTPTSLPIVMTIIDPTVSQFKKKPDYSKAVGSGFLTKRPSKRARALMKKLVYK